ncbi:hypothetical protein B5S28_g2469 [[Candida] boidinii]|nr:hypothetical protein B5S28_g2469 [[Candida] boidinii]OWB60898.1 hypothetical protein B5S29_g1781 [[Candida] boidinii]OWB74020.1 hypothetical protein B5S31_g3792 [[Candida] boidinii]OWB78787.1 hypothetical protein B5S32_g2991 [[Candida] boidinii]
MKPLQPYSYSQPRTRDENNSSPESDQLLVDAHKPMKIQQDEDQIQNQENINNINTQFNNHQNMGFPSSMSTKIPQPPSRRRRHMSNDFSYNLSSSSSMFPLSEADRRINTHFDSDSTSEMLPSTESVYHFGCPSSPVKPSDEDRRLEDNLASDDNRLPINNLSTSPIFGNAFTGDDDDNTGFGMLSQSTVVNEPTTATTSINSTDGLRHLNKIFHIISRNSSNLTEEMPLRKRQRVLNPDLMIKLQHLTHFQSRQQTLIKATDEFALDRDGKVYGILLEDTKLPDSYNISLYDDPSFFVVKNKEEASRRCSDIITELFEGDSPIGRVFSLKIENIGLTTLPGQIADFKDLVVYEPEGLVKPILHIHAAKNQLRSISPKIFEITGLEVLSIRENKIARIPGSIEKLTNLKNLNVANNKIKFFPHNILKLNNLEILRIRPNPLVELKDSKYVEEMPKYELAVTTTSNTNTNTNIKILRYIGKLHWITKNLNVGARAKAALKLARNLSTLSDTFNTEQDKMILDMDTDNELFQINEAPSFVPKLTELSLRTISKYPIAKNEILKWKTSVSERLYKLVVRALIHGTNGETCGSCDETIIESVAEVLEWWDLTDAKLIPIKRKFCSGRCVSIWKEKISRLRSGVDDMLL